MKFKTVLQEMGIAHEPRWQQAFSLLFVTAGCIVILAGSALLIYWGALILIDNPGLIVAAGVAVLIYGFFYLIVWIGTREE